MIPSYSLAPVFGISISEQRKIYFNHRNTLISLLSNTLYVLNSALSWPEPVAIICMVTFTFVGAAVSYRACSHIAVSMVTFRLPESGKRLCSFLTNMLMLLISGFILYYSTQLCIELWEQPVAEFRVLTAGETYLPLPIGSLITLLFIVERICFGPQDKRPVVMLGSA